MAVKVWTYDEALLRMADLCSRSEQCAADILRKLAAHGLSGDDAKRVTDRLTERRFLDEERFARSFASDKLRFSGWGRMKIRAALAAKHISPTLISGALASLEQTEYEEILMRCAKAKAASLDLTDFMDRRKLLRHLLSRGFESAPAVAAVRSLSDIW